MEDPIKNEWGLLFYLSGENGSRPQVAKGDPEPNFFENVEIMAYEQVEKIENDSQ